MQNDLEKALQAVFANVLEEYAFLFCETIDAPAQCGESSGPWIKISMQFDGPIRGELRLISHESFSREVAANALGLELDDPAVLENGCDALKELLNVVCGNLLTTMVGDQPVFNLTVPELSPVSEDEWRQALARPDCLAFMVGNEPVLLQTTNMDGNQ